LQAPPGPREALFLFRHKNRIEVLLAERTRAWNGVEGGVDNVLGRGGIAADVAFTLVRQSEWVYFAQNVTEIEVGIGNGFDVLSANVTEIALIASCHWAPVVALFGGAGILPAWQARCLPYGSVKIR
jgi:hypothetical protein